MISFEDFKKCEFKIGTVVSAERVEGSEKLLKLMIDFGVIKTFDVSPLPQEGDVEPLPQPVIEQRDIRQILSGIGQYYSPEALVGKQVPVIVNLEPRKIMGQESNGMVLAVVVDEKPILMHPDKEVPPGSMIR